MDLQQLWEGIFSEDEPSVRKSWASLNADEQVTVKALLLRIIEDPERIKEQRVAAQFALTIINTVQYSTAVSAQQNTGNASAALLQLTPAISTITLPDGALNMARELAHQTGQQLKFASGQLIASFKKDGTLVTASDIEANQKLGEALQARYPDHGVLSEEGEKIFHGEEWCWVIDPIDGTTNFTWGFPCWGVLIALLHYGYPVLGVAEFPPVGQQLYAARNQGAWRKTEIGYGDGPIRVAVDQSLTSTQLFSCGTRSLKQGQLKIPCKLRLPGSSGFDFAMLACGACVGAYDSTVHVWDVAALWPIIEEAGGQIVTNYPGGIFPLQAGVDYSSVAFAALGACSASLLAETLSALSDRFTLPYKPSNT